MARYELTRDAYFRACWFMQRQYRRRALMLALAGGACIVAGIAGSRISLPFALAAGGTLFLVIMGTRLAVNRARIYRIYDDNLIDAGEHSLTIGRDSFRISHSLGNAEIRWDQLRFVSESEEFILLYRGKDFAQIIPRAALNEQETALLKQKTSALTKI